jgi:hypothetical protein
MAAPVFAAANAAIISGATPVTLSLQKFIELSHVALSADDNSKSQSLPKPDKDNKEKEKQQGGED